VAEQGGFEEDRVAKIAASYDDSDLAGEDKAVLRFADCFLANPSAVDADVRRAMQAYFSDAEVVEITAALSLFLGFSKIAIALGPIPEGLPVMHMPLPDLPDSEN
jgi:alkylhydroperoxidase family enzyme